ncbi:bifunctional DNA primase/polymerase [Kribbella sp. NPDC051952]|uniref:bifunctional DNA primase/polymerase n=1 Tax=Kribbella sp. NPDC051952 TaxID=3154851 RepID=UPI0034375816
MYYRQPAGTQLGNTAGRLGWKIDTRGRGGYVVGAGSVVCGQRYRADVIRRPADLPNWIAEALTPPPASPTTVHVSAGRPGAAYGLKALSAQLNRLLASTKGTTQQRSERVGVRAGPRRRDGRLHPQAIRDELLSASGRIGRSRREAERTIESGLSAGLRRPTIPR